ncbi:DNA polymerase [Leptospira ognonensis]|uniref:DNA-directed DNA polymerase n=1 Tax=Leptospira ognonensis TaxID=2484945 RepID=A0A4R9K0E9_9LEPT|nr:DNA polymerase domain-containing protein [Leptospira ognonensis]TGL58148.1 DNA polymerase [Leptospira ognonensis]
MRTNTSQTTGYLFDIYHTEDKIYIWTKDREGKTKLFFDHYHPTIYARGAPEILRKLVKRFYELNALAEIPTFEEKILFYENKKVQVLKLVILRPSLLPKITAKLYALYDKFDIYHSDIEVPISYMVDHDIFPLAHLQIVSEAVGSENKIISISSLTSIKDLEYNIPPLKIMSLSLEKSQRISIEQNSLLIELSNARYVIRSKHPLEILQKINAIFEKEDPDIVLTAYGDQVIFPYLFTHAQRLKFPTNFDRDRTAPIRRQIQTKGSSFNTYGAMIFRAPSYPLFGRWHIDSRNSFVFKEADLLGIIELSRLSRLPIQKMARASTGKALTYIETDVALRMQYLVPWQKSAVEAPKSALQLLNADRGGLVFQPDITLGNVRENVAQLDFAQMYPSIMVIHNISPECVNCLCCTNDPLVPQVPKLGYTICNRRRGIVSEALAHVLERRAYYKQRKKETTGELSETYNAKQSSLKWMLVTSFGYLGYRNAKFGRLESHESVTAFGREKLLTAKDVAEENGYLLIHAITDSIFIQKEDHSPFTKEEIQALCIEIEKRTKVKIDADGVYTWLLFPPSTSDSKMPVANRYMGRFETGVLKSRGIGSRRKDLPIFIRKAQLEIVNWMCQFVSVEEIKKEEDTILAIYHKYDEMLQKETVSWKELLIQRSTSQEPEEYEVDGATSLSLLQLKEMGMHVQAGEKIRYIVTNRRAGSKENRYTAEEVLQSRPPNAKIRFDKEYYRKMLLSSFKEVWAAFASFEDFDQLITEQLNLPF